MVDDAVEVIDAPRARSAHRREVAWYALAVLGYIAIGTQTKGYMSFAWGLLYFVTVLEVLPRTIRRFRARRTTTVDGVGDS